MLRHRLSSRLLSDASDLHVCGYSPTFCHQAILRSRSAKLLARPIFEAVVFLALIGFLAAERVDSYCYRSGLVLAAAWAPIRLSLMVALI